MENISQPVVKKDHEAKMAGRSVYVGDYENDGVLVGKMLRSKLARARLSAVNFPTDIFTLISLMYPVTIM